MFSLPLIIFGKSAKCPSSHALLTFAGSRRNKPRGERITAHLEECEFCRAELQLLERCPHETESVMPTEIPATLRALAESVLGRPQGLQGFGLGECHRPFN